MGLKEKYEKMEEDIKLLVDGKIDDFYIDYDVAGQEEGVNSLALRFPSLAFCVSLKQELVSVNRKEN